ncbi:hypothetical protein [Haloarcula marismortui]|uniref:Uncharacterized protein n=1 Tax=Haloarcula marismortui ATCC 33799 TaxID=662475 RepID=M0JR49_9EURY|nr:hypothetical protein [Haloarcula californiae]EMA11607.1 hypothetical protein C435_19297 [Haloarcula californiae ATCC 33799]
MTDHPPVRTHRVLEVPGQLYRDPFVVVREEPPESQTNWEIVAWGQTKVEVLRSAAGGGAE